MYADKKMQVIPWPKGMASGGSNMDVEDYAGSEERLLKQSAHFNRNHETGSQRRYLV
jgi:hypothetical protein